MKKRHRRRSTRRVMSALWLMIATACIQSCHSSMPVHVPAAIDDPPGISNLWSVGTGVYSGSRPNNPSGFESLSRLGVRTIISVDGAVPDLLAAQAYAMGYVHVPVSYKGLDHQQRRALVHAMNTLPRPIYVHCHRGIHRGPAATVFALISLGEFSSERSIALLESIGTSHAYPGLFREVDTATPWPRADIESLDIRLSESAIVTGLSSVMADIGIAWQNLQLTRDAGWNAPASHPDLAPAAEAGVLADLFERLTRDHEVEGRDAHYQEMIQKALGDASQLEALLVTRPSAVDREATMITDRLGMVCAACHRSYRN